MNVEALTRNLLLIGTTAAWSNHPEPAEQIFNGIIRYRADNRCAHLGRCLIPLSKNDVPETISQLRVVVQNFPDFRDAKLMFAQITNHAGDEAWRYWVEQILKDEVQDSIRQKALALLEQSPRAFIPPHSIKG
ncbi:hypothetical protein [Variovorax sp.]|uniref:tetratricopeptide repeat protein n=1 Tax=Variovorax sp. TaxID=1871043 RepID=UPI002D66E613|nr:hypothetical protein [Variovorax sp.]HYP82997.1 hypothetical protein [Variovorax sp.]